MSVLSMKDVTKSYGPIRALDGVSLEIGAADVTALIGGDRERWGRVIREGGIKAE